MTDHPDSLHPSAKGIAAVCAALSRKTMTDPFAQLLDSYAAAVADAAFCASQNDEVHGPMAGARGDAARLAILTAHGNAVQVALDACAVLEHEGHAGVAAVLRKRLG